MRRLLNIVAMETTINNVEALQVSGTTAYKMKESAKTSLKQLTSDFPPEELLKEMMRLSQS